MPCPVLVYSISPWRPGVCPLAHSCPISSSAICHSRTSLTICPFDTMSKLHLLHGPCWRWGVGTSPLKKVLKTAIPAVSWMQPPQAGVTSIGTSPPLSFSVICSPQGPLTPGRIWTMPADPSRSLVSQGFPRVQCEWWWMSWVLLLGLMRRGSVSTLSYCCPGECWG